MFLDRYFTSNDTYLDFSKERGNESFFSSITGMRANSWNFGSVRSGLAKVIGNADISLDRLRRQSYGVVKVSWTEQ